MRPTSQSEYLPLKEVLIKPVANAFINESKIKAEWESLNYIAKPDLNKALLEFNEFKDILTSGGARAVPIPTDNSLSLDALYCRDASIATDFGMILCRMGKAERMNEPGSLRKVFQMKGVPILGEIISPGTLEGGDVAWIDESTLAVGRSYRTNGEGIRQLKELLEPRGIKIIVVELPHYKGANDVFHLMSVFSPIDKDLAVVYSPLMPINFRNELIKRGFDLVEVPEDEFDSLGCNVLALAPRKCLVVGGNPKTCELMIESGCEILDYKGEHISLMGGGGPTCLTRPLLRME